LAIEKTINKKLDRIAYKSNVIRYKWWGAKTSRES